MALSRHHKKSKLKYFLDINSYAAYFFKFKHNAKKFGVISKTVSGIAPPEDSPLSGGAGNLTEGQLGYPNIMLSTSSWLWFSRARSSIVISMVDKSGAILQGAIHVTGGNFPGGNSPIEPSKTYYYTNKNILLNKCNTLQLLTNFSFTNNE